MKHTTFYQFMFCLLYMPCIFAQTESTGATPQLAPIEIGMTAPFGGQTQDIGSQMKLGVETYFAAINAKGGVDGRKLKLTALDDQYDPILAGQNMRQLVDNQALLAVIGNVGTPTSLVTFPVANEKKVLLFGADSGASFLRKVPTDRHVINFRASFDDELNDIIKGLMSIGIKPTDMAFFLQNDSFGDEVYMSAVKALNAAGFTHADNLPVGRYQRNTLNVEEGLSQILQSAKSPKAIIVAATYAPVVKFVHLTSKILPNTLYVNVSLEGIGILSRVLESDTKRFIVMQPVPYLDKSLPAVQEYQDDLKKFDVDAKPNFGSFEGYLVAKLFVMGLDDAAKKQKLTREGIIDSFESMKDVDIGIGVKMTFNKEIHEALHRVWPTILRNGSFVPVEWSALKPESEKQ